MKFLVQRTVSVLFRLLRHQDWEHLAGTTSASFEAGEHQQIAVKVIDDRGNELLVTKRLGED